MVLPEDEPPTAPKPLALPVRWLLKGFALVCLALGIVGIFLPGLPSTVFILMAAWAAARSSPPLYRWLWHHRLFGPMLRDWSRGGQVSRRSKWAATTMMAASAAILLLTHTPRWVLALACLVHGLCAGVALATARASPHHPAMKHLLRRQFLCI